MIDQRFKFGAILAFTLIQLSNDLDGGSVVPQLRKKNKKKTNYSNFSTFDCRISYFHKISQLAISYGSDYSAVNKLFITVMGNYQF